MNPKPLVLIVEDHPPTRAMMARTLESAGFRTRTASETGEALRIALSETPDLILMDVGLPGLRGDAATAALKRNALLRETPVVLVSAGENLDLLCSQSGAVGLLRKPFKTADLVRCADRWTRPAAVEEPR